MVPNSFAQVNANPDNPKWAIMNTRVREMYRKHDDIRTEFERDYTRILHSTAYRRLKHKTQVFFATHNDHICTRIEHVNHVVSVSYTIATYLGLNAELTNAIAIGHDLGHAPFGHAGESVLKEIAKKEIGEIFWHERNSLRFIDKIETLQGPNGKEKNLNLTYAVRDGIISHCGEVDEDALFPREEAFDLEDIEKPSQYAPYTWEGCIVKIADKISYLGRDIEDAIVLEILTYGQLRELIKILMKSLNINFKEINNTILIHDFIIDLCKSSTPSEGIRLSKPYIDLMNLVKGFNYDNIYNHPRLIYYKDYSRLIITSIYKTLADSYSYHNTVNVLRKNAKYWPNLVDSFSGWLYKYSNIQGKSPKHDKYTNVILYDIENEKDYKHAILDYISGMTDLYAETSFKELTSF